MSKPLPPGFKLTEGNFGDSSEIWHLCKDAYKEVAVAFKNYKEDVHPWAMNVFPRRWTLPDITFYTITEESVGYD